MENNSQQQEQQGFTREEVIMLTNVIVPGSIYDSRNGNLLPEIFDAVNKLMHYDDFADISIALMLNDPAELKANIHNADMSTLMVFLKFLMTKIGETANNDILIAIQEYVISFLQYILAEREKIQEARQANE